MRIAQLAPLTERVPPTAYGGTELVVSLLTEELVRRGHQVTLFASGDSVTSANLVSVIPHALRDNGKITSTRWPAFDIISLLEFERRQGEFDLVHNHMGWQALPWLRNFQCAVITTNHNPIKDYCRPIYFACKSLPYVAISDAYRKLNYSDTMNYIATIYNGIAVEQYFSSTQRQYLLFLGRVCHDKGTAAAIEIARRLNLPLKIAGKIDSVDQGYYEQEVKPHIGNRQVEYLGEVTFEQKTDLLSKALAVVYPISFPEPFGLVMAEALASGTPVMALHQGSAPEVVSDGETGIVARSIDELVSRYPEINGISPQSCMDRARRLFCKERMADEYEATYLRMLQGRMVVSGSS